MRPTRFTADQQFSVVQTRGLGPIAWFHVRFLLKPAERLSVQLWRTAVWVGLQVCHLSNCELLVICGRLYPEKSSPSPTDKNAAPQTSTFTTKRAPSPHHRNRTPRRDPRKTNKKHNRVTSSVERCSQPARGAVLKPAAKPTEKRGGGFSFLGKL